MRLLHRSSIWRWAFTLPRNQWETLVRSTALWLIQRAQSSPTLRLKSSIPVSGFDRSTTTDASGRFDFTNIPFNPYHLIVTAEGFAATVQDVEPRSAVPVSVAITLKVAGSTTQVTVEAGGGPDRERLHLPH